MAPLDQIRVLELGGIGPGPFCGMLLADMGADVIRIDRPGEAGRDPAPVVGRGKRSVVLDLKQPDGVDALLALVTKSDILIDPWRPGVAERLGVGPQPCLARNPRLVYARMTGWGQSGPLAARAGHDIDYIAISGALHAIGGSERPVPPLNLVGDYGGGALYLAVGILAALVERGRTDAGQVVDAAMVDGAASLMAPTYELMALGAWTDQRSANVLDGAAPFYTVYETRDGGFMAVGALEPRFYAELLDVLGLVAADLPGQYDRSGWPLVRATFTDVFAQHTRDEWERRFAGRDACVAPVLSMSEAPEHPHNVARQTFIEIDGVIQPAPAPRFGASEPPGRAPRGGEHTVEVLRDLGSDDSV